MRSHLRGRVLRSGVVQTSDNHRRARSLVVSERRIVRQPEGSAQAGRPVDEQAQQSDRARGTLHKVRKNGHLSLTQFYRMRLSRRESPTLPPRKRPKVSEEEDNCVVMEGRIKSDEDEACLHAMMLREEGSPWGALGIADEDVARRVERFLG